MRPQKKDGSGTGNVGETREIREDGLNLGETNVKLLEKIEELMLYMIEKDNEVANLKSM